MSCRRAAPYILRTSASGALLVGSLVNLVNGEKVNPFFYASLYSAVIYTTSNLYEAYTVLCKPTSFVQRLEEQQPDLEMGK